jgi:hypothetical protein
MSFNVDDYVDVAARINLFYEKFPEGRLNRLGEPQVLEVGSKLFIMYTAQAFRTPDDPLPGVGTAWEPFPGPTQFTRDSELMNAETAAWGRAIIAAGIGSKKIASAEEVRNRQPDPSSTQKARPAVSDVPAPDLWYDATAERMKALEMTNAQIRAMLMEIGAGVPENVSSYLRLVRGLNDSRRGMVDVWLLERESAGTPLATEPVA